MTKTTKFIVILNTCPGSITAKQIAQDLVVNNIAACVNVIPSIQSYFKWGNKIQIKDEYLLVIKTTTEKYEAVRDKIIKLHPYDVPEIVRLPIDAGLESYLNWVEQSTR